MFRKRTGNSINIRKRTTQVLPEEDPVVTPNEPKFGQSEDDTTTHLKRHIGSSFGPTRSKFAKRAHLQAKIQERQQEVEHKRTVSSTNNTSITSASQEPPASASERDRDDSDGELFTKEEIAKVRAEKQMMRNKMNEFIPVRTNAVTGKHASTTIMFGVPTDTDSNARLGRGTTLADLVDGGGGGNSSGESDGSDSDSWVMEQVSKGTTKQSIEMLRQEYSQKRTAAIDPNGVLIAQPSQVSTKRSADVVSAPFGALNFKYIKCATCDEITREIDASIQTLSENIRSCEARIAGYQKDIDETMVDIEKSKSQTAENEKNHAFFCQLSEFVRNVVDFLTEKAPEIEDIEERLADIQSEHNSFCRSQRKTLVQRAESMTYTATAPYDPRGSVKPDLSDLLTLTESGEASSERTKFAEAKKCLLDEAVALLSDTTDEYKTVGNVLKPFSQWKCNPATAASYRQAYCSMVMPMLLAPLVRYEMLFWDPLSQQQQQQNLSDMQWVKSVMKFSAETTLDGEMDPDTELTRALVNSSVLPKLKEAILNGDWSPFSKDQNETVMQLVKSVVAIAGHDFGSDIASEILGDALAVLQDAVETVKLPGDKSALKCEPIGSREMLDRLFERTISLFGNVCRWHHVMKDGSPALQRLVIDNFLNVKLLPYIRTLGPEDAYNVSYAIIGYLPKEWKVKTLPSLKMFLTFTETLIGSTKKDLTIHFV